MGLKAIRMEAIASSLEAIAIGLKAIRMEAIASSAIGLKAIRMEAIASSLETIAIGLLKIFNITNIDQSRLNLKNTNRRIVFFNIEDWQY